MDLKIIIEDYKIKTDIFIKATNKQLFLDYRSAHPPSVFKSIVYSQALRVKTICSEVEFVDKQLTNLRGKFKDRNYPELIIEEQFQRAMAKDRADLLRPKTYPHYGSPEPIKKKFWPFFIITYNRHNPPLKKWLEEELHLLQLDPKNKAAFPNRPGIAYRQPPNNKMRLVRSRFKELPYENNTSDNVIPGCFRCTRKVVSLVELW